MQHSLSRLDRLRVERLVWSLDQQLYDLPRHSRITTRREVRANLLAAAQDVGTGQALRRVGSSRQLAQDYLTAELGPGPRHSWIAATYFAVTGPLVLNFFLGESASAYQQAVTSTDPQATGTHVWQGVTWLQNAVTFTFDHGHASRTGGSWTVLVYVLWLAGTIACGRLWRLIHVRQGQAPTAPSPGGP
ncbi:hypothetical protein ABZ468_12425 [Streptomyces sp. NPDC005708]|uniref:hypothetical protein n=1 Tax=Streptomyces sp. NPDC005708 TaxID=3154564 RepID=UPI0033D7C6CF